MDSQHLEGMDLSFYICYTCSLPIAMYMLNKCTLKLHKFLPLTQEHSVLSSPLNSHSIKIRENHLQFLDTENWIVDMSLYLERYATWDKIFELSGP